MYSPPTQSQRLSHTATAVPCPTTPTALAWFVCCIALLALLVLTPASLLLATAQAQPSDATDALQQQLEALQRERTTWLQQKRQILSLLTQPTTAAPPRQRKEQLQAEIAADGEVQLQQPQEQQQQQADSGQSAVELVDVEHLLSFIPATELATLQSTIADLLSTHGVDGTVYVTLSRTNPHPPTDPPAQPHTAPAQQTTSSNVRITPTIAINSQPAAVHDVVSSTTDDVPRRVVAGVAPPPAPQQTPHEPRFPLSLPSNDTYPHLLLPPPTLPPYSPSTPATTYLPYVRAEFLHAYHAYCRDAWGADDYMPVSRRGGVSYGMSLTMVDALDTLIVMGEWGEVERAVQWLADNLRFGHQQDINVFETTIRILGSLLASAHLINTTTTPALPPTTRDALSTILLTHAATLGSHLLHAFQTPTGIPYGTLSLQSRTMYNPSWSAGASTMAELGSVQLEFQYLSRVTGRVEYAEAVDGVMVVVRRLGRSLYGQFMSVDRGEMVNSVITLGARVDSLYEYFLKQWLLAGKSSERVLMRDMWLESGQAIRDNLLLIAMGDGYVEPYTPDFLTNRSAYPADARLFVAERINDQLTGKMDHLVCFLPGVYALSSYHRTCDSKKAEAKAEADGGGESAGEGGCSDEEWLGIARELTRTCVAMYDTETGLAPEIVQFSMRRRHDEERQYQERQQQYDDAKAAHDKAHLAYNLRRTLVYANTTQSQTDREKLLYRLEQQHNASLASLPPLPQQPQPPTAQPAFSVDGNARHNLLRPETMESLFVLWRVTGEAEWREAGWRLFSAFVAWCRVDGGGYTGLVDVMRGGADREARRAEWVKRLHDWQAANGRAGEGEAGYVFEWSNWKDHMESFWLSETLKYAYLLFEEDTVLPFDEYVFNTEAHPLPVVKLEDRRDEEPSGYAKRRLALEQLPQPQAQQPPQQQQQQQQQQHGAAKQNEPQQQLQDQQQQPEQQEQAVEALAQPLTGEGASSQPVVSGDTVTVAPVDSVGSAIVDVARSRSTGDTAT